MAENSDAPHVKSLSGQGGASGANRASDRKTVGLDILPHQPYCAAGAKGGGAGGPTSCAYKNGEVGQNRPRQTSSSDSWIILRCSGRHTLALAASLAADGVETWTPTETRLRLAGRNRETVEQQIAILPEYVFAPCDRLDDLLAMTRAPSLQYRVWDPEKRKMVVKGHPSFTLFRSNGEIRRIPETSLSPLRALEESLRKVLEGRRKAANQPGPAPKFTAGQTICVDGWGVQGLNLTVVATNEGKTVVVTHPSWSWDVEISAWKLREVQLQSSSNEHTAAKAA